jgi:hypothetical protein
LVVGDGVAGAAGGLDVGSDVGEAGGGAGGEAVLLQAERANARAARMEVGRA